MSALSEGGRAGEDEGHRFQELAQVLYQAEGGTAGAAQSSHRYSIAEGGTAGAAQSSHRYSIAEGGTAGAAQSSHRYSIHIQYIAEGGTAGAAQSSHKYMSGTHGTYLVNPSRSW